MRLAAFGRRVRRWMRPPRILRPTRAGWLFLVIIFGVGFAALNTGNNLLYLVLSLMLSFLVLSGVLSESALRGVEVRRRLPRELFAGRENSVHIEVRNNQKRVTAYAIVVEDRLASASDGHLQVLTGGAPKDRGSRKARKRNKRIRQGEPAGRCFVLRAAPGACESRRYTISPARRGPLEYAGFRVSTRFPFGLFLKYREYDCPESALVYPEIASHGAPVRLQETETTGDAHITRIGTGGTVGGLREFAAGDSLRRIHWRNSLRRGELLVTETEDDRDAEVEVLLRGRISPDRAPDRASGFERSVSRAASEVVSHLQSGLSVALRTDATYLSPDTGSRQRARLLSFLAVVTPEGRSSEEASG